MKKVTTLILFAGLVSISALAQAQTAERSSRNSGFNSTASTDSPEMLAKKSEAVRACPDLNDQLSRTFGSDYILSDRKVANHLLQIIGDKTQDIKTREVALFVVFGNDAKAQLHRINGTK